MRSINVFLFALLLSACGSVDGEDELLGTARNKSDFSDSDLGECNSESEGEKAVSACSPATGEASSANPGKLLGSWVSPACGQRTYVRQIEFNPNGKFVAQDLVSPCPRDVVCFWSGIIHTLGSYRVEEGTIELRPDQPRSASGLPYFPRALQMDPATAAPVEVSPEGARCVYTRGRAPEATETRP